MKLIVSIIVLILAQHQVLATTSLLSQELNLVGNNNDQARPQGGPISNLMESLATHTSDVAEEISSGLEIKIEQTVQLLMGNIETVLGTALDKLTEPIVEAQLKYESEPCQKSLNDLKQRMDSELNVCTQDLSEMLLIFQNDSQALMYDFNQFTAAITNLPQQCRLIAENSASSELFGFTSLASCFIEKITEINRDFGVLLTRINLNLSHTRQSAKQSVEAARQCGENVVADTLTLMDKVLINCQLETYRKNL